MGRGPASLQLASIQRKRGHRIFELCRQFAETYPAARLAMREVAAFEAAQVADITDVCSQFDVGVSFTPERAGFVSGASRGSEATGFLTIVGD